LRLLRQRKKIFNVLNLLVFFILGVLGVRVRIVNTPLHALRHQPHQTLPPLPSNRAPFPHNSAAYMIELRRVKRGAFLIKEKKGVTRRSKLDTVAGLTRRIFLCTKGVVQERSETRQLHARQNENTNKTKKKAHFAHFIARMLVFQKAHSLHFARSPADLLPRTSSESAQSYPKWAERKDSARARTAPPIRPSAKFGFLCKARWLYFLMRTSKSARRTTPPGHYQSPCTWFPLFGGGFGETQCMFLRD